MHILTSVSYTHLDVYKRQPMTLVIILSSCVDIRSMQIKRFEEPDLKEFFYGSIYSLSLIHI